MFVRLLMSLADPLTLSLGAAPLHDLPQLYAMHTMHCNSFQHCLEAACRIAAAATALHRCPLYVCWSQASDVSRYSLGSLPAFSSFKSSFTRSIARL